MRQSVMLSDLEVPGSDSASTVVLNHTGELASSAAPPSPLWRAALALAAADDVSPVSASEELDLLLAVYMSHLTCVRLMMTSHPWAE